ncbi:MAG: DUF5691 domain-containing protein, partial [Chloroflexota bacterium]
WDRANARVKRALFRQFRLLSSDEAREFFVGRSTDMELPDRSNYIDWMMLGQSARDEALFESLLDDEDPQISQSAADRLKRMASSAYVERMVDRLAGRFRLENADTEDPKITFDPIEELTTAMKRDTVDRQPPRDLSKEEGWLFYMMTCIPPRYWTDWLGKPPAELVRIGQAQKEIYIQAWVRAANYHRDMDWANALIDHLLETEETHLLSWLMDVLPQEAREDVTLRVWRKSSKSVYINAMLPGSQPWSPSLSREVVDLYNVALEEDIAEALRWIRHGLANHVYYLHASVYDDLCTLLSQYTEGEDVNDDTRKRIDEALHVLAARRDIGGAFDV